MIVYKVQRFGSWEWLDLDLQIDTDGPWDAVSTYEVIDGVVSPDLGYAIAEDRRRVLEPWGSLIHAETADERIFTGIVESVTSKDAGLRVRVREWHGYLHGIPFLGRIWGVRIDPADLVRQLWDHVQSYPTGNLGMQVVGSTPVRVGTDSDDLMLAAKGEMEQRKADIAPVERMRKEQQALIKRRSAAHDRVINARDKNRAAAVKAYDSLVKQKNPKATPAQITAAKNLVETRRGQVADARDAKKYEIDPLKTHLEGLRGEEQQRKTEYQQAQQVFRDWQERVRQDGGAWKVLAEDTPDCWDALQDLAAVAPFDFTTMSERTHGAPKLTLKIHYPRAGRARDDLVFDQDVNLAEMPEVRLPDGYASEVVGLGAGEGVGYDGGSVALRASVTRTDARIRRVETFSDPSITKLDRLRTASRAELQRLRGLVEVPEIVVREHPNCPIGAWAAGDDIYLRLARVPHFGVVQGWFKVNAWQRVGTSKAKLRLERVHDV